MKKLICLAIALAAITLPSAAGNARDAVKEKETVSLYLFPVTALFFTVLMTALFFVEDASSGGPVRIDTFFYGRYNDVLQGTLLAAALFKMRADPYCFVTDISPWI